MTNVSHHANRNEGVPRRVEGPPGGLAALNAWRAAVERLGILVFQTSEIGLREMRGISIPHGPLPVSLLNSTDAPHGRIFTLLHEFAMCC
jgi:Zn-dependent peptidase ImmA (M78 family)